MKIISVVGVILLCAFVAVNYWRGTYALIWADGLLITLLLGNLLFLKTADNVEAAAGVVAFLLAAFALFFAYAAAPGGIVWLLVLPAGFFVLLGMWRGSIASILVLAVSLGLVSTSWIPLDRYSAPALIGSYLAVSILAFVSAYFAESNRARFETLSVTDPLTGLLNRRGFSSAAAAELFRTRRYGRPLSLLILDLDHFKSVNDKYGHLVGDGVLTGFGAILRRNTRKTDTVGRWGGEEFVILATETPKESARLLGEKLSILVQDAPLCPHCVVTTSVGVAQVELTDSLDSCFLRADKALYIAKKEGRNRVEVEGCRPAEYPLSPKSH